MENFQSGSRSARLNIAKSDLLKMLAFTRVEQGQGANFFFVTSHMLHRPYNLHRPKTTRAAAWRQRLSARGLAASGPLPVPGRELPLAHARAAATVTMMSSSTGLRAEPPPGLLLPMSEKVTCAAAGAVPQRARDDRRVRWVRARAGLESVRAVLSWEHLADLRVGVVEIAREGRHAAHGAWKECLIGSAQLCRVFS